MQVVGKTFFIEIKFHCTAILAFIIFVKFEKNLLKYIYRKMTFENNYKGQKNQMKNGVQSELRQYFSVVDNDII